MTINKIENYTCLFCSLGGNIDEEEKRITYEKEKCETLLSEINEELKSAREARKQGIQDLTPHYTGLG